MNRRPRRRRLPTTGLLYDKNRSILHMKIYRRAAHSPRPVPQRNRHLRLLSALPSAASPSSWDSYLSRGASVSQIVGIGLALAGLFYTVIPLYQKAAVDEQLARREVELKVVEAALAEVKAETYRLRRDNYMRVATRAAADECSDARRGFMPVPQGFKESDQEYRRSLDVGVVECINRYLARASVVKELNSAELATWRSWAMPIAVELEEKRQTARETIAALPKKAAADPSVLEPTGDFVRRADEFLSRYDAFRTLEQRQERLRRLFDQRVESTQTSIANAYRQLVSVRLLRELEPKLWRDERASREADTRSPEATSAKGP